jgi:hypothetical protein
MQKVVDSQTTRARHSYCSSRAGSLASAAAAADAISVMARGVSCAVECATVVDADSASGEGVDGSGGGGGSRLMMISPGSARAYDNSARRSTKCAHVRTTPR